MQDLNPLILGAPPPLDAAWQAHEAAAGLLQPKPVLSALERQPIYASDCRARNAAMMALGARDHELSRGVRVSSLTVPGLEDGYEIPVLRYEAEEEDKEKEQVILIYIHGGGLLVGEADSEELTCRRLVKYFPRPSSSHTGGQEAVKLYSIGYRLMPQVAAQTCLGDVTSAFKSIRQLHPAARLVLVGSSSGGELAAFLSQALAPGSLSGILLRCPVTADAPAHVPSGFEDWHTSASPPFVTSLLGLFNRQVPRDGFERMPLEIPTDEVEGLEMARTWVQVCTNDVLYSDGVCYAKLLQDAGIEVKVDVVEGWPHTFWLKAPHLDRALEADNELLRGLAWVLEL
ncbi:Alpha/Beta hydrolase protein [Truncatella angustata]|uniref:Alpha/Beta hydrolase protein n=1 Tax=Truncatella angustata TaxID=152316 RepID=A0A9P8ZVD5_9PEZI|nr:Alpha/Beta hydrolase protein [Truncatella angustata]KAH6651915.1 Alpha/Beta hydrolase protein [Truncatella angustata]